MTGSSQTYPDDWLLNAPDTLLTDMAGEFRGNWETSNLKKSLVNDVLTELVSDYPLLSFFNSYLKSHVEGWFTSPSVTASGADIQAVIQKVRELLKTKVATALVFGAYDGTLEGNKRYPNLDSFLYQNRIGLYKTDVQELFSPSKVLSELIASVQSAPFFNSYGTYGEMRDALSALSDAELFDVKRSPTFAALTGYVMVDTTREGEPYNQISVDWDIVRNWLFGGDNREPPTPERVLKSLVRTQLYRPLFFKHDNYKKFTSNESSYWCATKKSYINHDGNETPLVLDEDTGEVKLDESGLGRTDSYWIEDPKYRENTNRLEYRICYNPIQIVDDKFVYNDVVFYVVKYPKESNKVTRVYFNEFSGSVGQSSKSIPVDGEGKFQIGNKTYIVDDNLGRILVESTEQEDSQHVFHQEFVQEIVDNKFKVDGVQYVMEMVDGTRYVKCGQVDDQNLQELIVTEDGEAQYAPWNLRLRFDFDNNEVQAIKRHNTAVMDKVCAEHCAYDDRDDLDIVDSIQSSLFQVSDNGFALDGVDYVIDGDKVYQKNLDNTLVEKAQIRDNIFRLGDGLYRLNTNMRGKYSSAEDIWKNSRTFQWYFGNEVNRLRQEHPEFTGRLLSLSDGTLYSGTLTDASYFLKFAHELEQGYVVTKGYLVKRDAEQEVEEPIGILFYGNMNLPMDGKIAKGRLTSDGLVDISDVDDKDGEPPQVFVLKDIHNGYNNLNAIWTSQQTWNECITRTEDIGKAQTESDDSGILWAYFDDAALPSRVSFTPTTPTSPNATSAYSISLDESGLQTHVVNVTDDGCLHFMMGGDRYFLNVSNGKIGRNSMREMPVQTLDFSTTYTYNFLLDSLLVNLKQYMMNDIVQHMIDAATPSTLLRFADSPELTATGQMDLYNELDLYLDMFNDAMTSGNFAIMRSVQTTSDEYAKFSEVFKNHVKQIDDRNTHGCFASQYLQTLTNQVFQKSSMLDLVVEPSVSAERQAGVDEFTYQVTFDLHLTTNKKQMRECKDSTADQYILGSATVKDIKCNVTLVPEFSYSDSTMRYKVKYEIEGGTHRVEYGQVIYNHEGKTKNKFIDTKTTYVDLDTSEGFGTYGATDAKNLEHIVKELVSKNLDNMFPDGKIADLMVDINETLMPYDRIWVSTVTTMNDGQPGRIWSLDEKDNIADIENPSENRVVSIDYGHVNVGDQMYDMSADASILSGGDGADFFHLVKVDSHLYTPPVGVQVEDAGTEDEKERCRQIWENWNGKGEDGVYFYDAETGTIPYKALEQVHVAIGAELVDQSYLENYFTLTQLNEHVFLKFKNLPVELKTQTQTLELKTNYFTKFTAENGK